MKKQKKIYSITSLTIFIIYFLTVSILSAQESSAPSKTFFSVIKEGGILMIPLGILLLIALTIVFERIFYIIKTKSYSLNKIKNELEFAAGKIKAECREDLEEDLKYYLNGYITKQEKGLNLLHTIGNISPLYGFFGTVIGMIEAFSSIAAASDINANIVASGISTALLTTAGGLAIALVCFVFHGIFGYYSKKTEENGMCFVELLSQDKPRMADLLLQFNKEETIAEQKNE
ncbi:MAG: MotA/TolQ/ExbB proton channel family protein [Spirochaetia bacterium]|nr:MotA/TolQ/ExbB proton channel family protein [Spirochaetia bacterium]